MLSKSSFALAFDALDREQKIRTQIDHVLSEYAYGEVVYDTPSENALRKILKDEMNDTNDWLAWWADGYRVVWWIEDGVMKECIISEGCDFYDFLIDPKSKTVCPYDHESEYARSLFENAGTEKM